MHPALSLGIVVRAVAHCLGSFPYQYHAKVAAKWGHTSVLELVSKELRRHFNFRLRLDVHLLGVFECNQWSIRFKHMPVGFDTTGCGTWSKNGDTWRLVDDLQKEEESLLDDY